MKKILVLILATVFVFLLSSYILANTLNSDLIYTVTEDPAFLNATVYGTAMNSSSLGGSFSYRKNQETYIGAIFNKNFVFLGGSYLSSSGLFLGASGDFDAYNTTIELTPGYRYNFNKSNYIAGSVTWQKNFSYNDLGVLDFALYGKYFDQKTKMEGNVDFGSFRIAAGGDINRKIADGIVIGSNFNLHKVYYGWDSFYAIDLDGGISFNNNFLASNIRLLLESPVRTPIQIFPSLKADGIVYLGNLGLGANYSVSTNFEQFFQSYSLKGKLRFSDSSLLFVFQPSNKSWVLSLEKR